jgi:dTDP-4-dehydrorhamnose 3,5-epimerase
MNIESTPLEDVVVLEPTMFHDDRGFFCESWSKRAFDAATMSEVEFVQDNHSRSRKGVLRGLHYQVHPYEQGKLVRVVSGKIWDVVVDLRTSSHTFGSWFGLEISAENTKQLWVPPGLAHGFLAISDWVDVLYKTTSYHVPESERSLRWNDTGLGIEWPLDSDPILSERDAGAPGLAHAELFS